MEVYLKELLEKLVKIDVKMQEIDETIRQVRGEIHTVYWDFKETKNSKT